MVHLTISRRILGASLINKRNMSDPELAAIIQRYKDEFANAIDEDEIKPLVLAAIRGRLEDVMVLVEHGMDVNEEGFDDIIFGYHTPITGAVRNGHKQVIEYLLQHEADPSIVNHEERTALHVAVEKTAFYFAGLCHGEEDCTNDGLAESVDIIRLLTETMSPDAINALDRTSLQDIDGQQTALDIAYYWMWGSTNELVMASEIRQEVIQILRENGALANRFDENGNDVGVGNGDLNTATNGAADPDDNPPTALLRF